ncbi:MAG: hypothetical protein FCO83_03190 [Spiroplasma sp. WSS]|uniref:hypothetical protein n=1 Tax=unclassified Spiroplasma TaxID=2637901 RepID=UPI0011F57D4C|nr:hypothetical protein [Spiroplasma endosymbiont of Lariophagus distinguendus]TLF25027.1 MAG: hypothetical protein FCO83_03190 [Spiroplasma sp. WSS]
MLINKTADECIIETGGALFQCFVDTNLTVDQKKMCINWIVLFLNYQDAVILCDEEKINSLQKELSETFTTDYYKNALKEFNNANLIYKKTILTNFKNVCLENTSQDIINIITQFHQSFIKTIDEHKKSLTFLNLNKIYENLLLLFFIIHYHLGYQFKQELIPIIRSFTNMIKIPIYIEQNDSHVKMLLMKKILQDNEQLFEDLELIQLRNFIHSLDDIFANGLNISSAIEKLILTRPHKIKHSMNMLFKKHGIKLQEILWKNNKESNPTIGNMIMHLFAYETYYVQRNHNYETYEQLVLNNVLTDPLFQKIFIEYKTKNQINKVI